MTGQEQGRQLTTIDRQLQPFGSQNLVNLLVSTMPVNDYKMTV
jgi:hypothetical protein